MNPSSLDDVRIYSRSHKQEVKTDTADSTLMSQDFRSVQDVEVLSDVTEDFYPRRAPVGLRMLIKVTHLRPV